LAKFFGHGVSTSIPQPRWNALNYIAKNRGYSLIPSEFTSKKNISANPKNSQLYAKMPTLNSIQIQQN
jgi:hypothetical protein